MSTSLADGELIESGGWDLTGDPLAMARCYERFAPMVDAYLRRMTSEHDREDVVQQVFLELWRARASYDPARSMEAWILAIAHKRGVDHLRRRASAAATADAAGREPAPGTETRFDEALATADTVREALAGLPAEQREALVLAYFAGYSQSQIASRLGVPLGTVKARSWRGLRSLAATLVPKDLA